MLVVIADAIRIHQLVHRAHVSVVLTMNREIKLSARTRDAHHCCVIALNGLSLADFVA